MTNNRTQSFSPTPSTARHTRRIALALLLAVSTACSSAIAGGPSRAAPKPSRSSTPSSVAPTQTPSTPPASTSTTTVVPDIGQQAFSTYQQAFALLNQLAESPTGRSIDPRLPTLMLQPWYAEVIADINLLRTRNQFVKGSYSFSNFQLSQVTPDGRVIFFDCQTNSQELYDSRTGAKLTNSGTLKIDEQVVVARGADGAWRVADHNIKTGNACGA